MRPSAASARACSPTDPKARLTRPPQTCDGRVTDTMTSNAASSSANSTLAQIKPNSKAPKKCTYIQQRGRPTSPKQVVSGQKWAKALWAVTAREGTSCSRRRSRLHNPVPRVSIFSSCQCDRLGTSNGNGWLWSSSRLAIALSRSSSCACSRRRGPLPTRARLSQRAASPDSLTLDMNATARVRSQSERGRQNEDERASLFFPPHIMSAPPHLCPRRDHLLPSSPGRRPAPRR